MSKSKQFKLTPTVGENGATINYEDDFNHPLTFGLQYPEHHIDADLNTKGKELANLIAAAPELLEALKELSQLAHGLNKSQHAGIKINPGEWSLLYQVCNKSNGIIAKAEIV